MAASIRRMLWGTFAALLVLVVIGLTLNVSILRLEQRQESDLQADAPLIDAVNNMDADTIRILSASRAYLLNPQTQFLQQYDDALRDFEKSSSLAVQQTSDPRDARLVHEFRGTFLEIKRLVDQQIALAKDGRAANGVEFMTEAARLRSATTDYAGTLTQNHRNAQQAQMKRMDYLRQWLTPWIVIAGLAVMVGAAFAVRHIERSLNDSIARQVRRTETMIAGMADGVMLVDGDGRTVFINPAGQKLLGTNEIGTPIDRHATVYHLRSEDHLVLEPTELPAAQALATGRAIEDRTMVILRGDHEIAISMNAAPLREEGTTTGVLVTFRDVTERVRLEGELQTQAERAQTLADAGAFFASNIDPVWVTQAIAERVAEVLGDWAAVILKSGDSNELRVASIYHRDMASLGLAWSYICRQPLVTGEGFIGQVVATGSPR